MPQYRAYTLDKSGHIVAPHVAECADDAIAMEFATKLSKDNGRAVELWEGARRVARVDHDTVDE